MKMRKNFISNIDYLNMPLNELYLECLKFGLPVKKSDDRTSLQIYFQSVIEDDIYEKPFPKKIKDILEEDLFEFATEKKASNIQLIFNKLKSFLQF